MPRLPPLPELIGTVLFYGLSFAGLLIICLAGSYAVSLLLARILTGSAC